jgi:hypothetical protein
MARFCGSAVVLLYAIQSVRAPAVAAPVDSVRCAFSRIRHLGTFPGNDGLLSEPTPRGFRRGKKPSIFAPDC